MTSKCTASSTTVVLAVTFCTTVFGQIRSDLTETGSDNTGLVFDLFIVSSDFGELSEVRASGGTILGESSVVVFPTQPSFTDIFISSWKAEMEPVIESFEFVGGLVNIDVSLMKYEARLMEPAQAPLGKLVWPGNFRIDSVQYEVSAMVRIVSSQLGLNITLSHDGIIQDLFRGSIVMSGGDLFLGRTPPPDLSLQADPLTLPNGITALELRLSMDAGNTNYRGPAVSALMGDSDLDNDVDLLDYAFSNTCLTDMTNVLCKLHDFDADGVVSLHDFGGFQLAFSGDASGP